MNPYWKDLIDAIAKLAGLVTVAGGVVALAIQLSRWREERRAAATVQQQATAQRAEELHWRKVSLAREVVRELHHDERASDAMRMIDWGKRHYVVEGTSQEITRDEVYEALRTSGGGFTSKEAFIRDCFDTFFGHFQLIQHSIDIGVLEFRDVTYPASYYAGKMAKRRAVFQHFLDTYEYTLASKFLNKFEGYATPAA
jgi:hypothetical protein